MPHRRPVLPFPDFEHADAAEIVAWAHATYGRGLVVTASFGDAVLPHLVAVAAPQVEVVLLDTGYLFAETHWFAEQLRRRFDLDLRVVAPAAGVPADGWMEDVDACCRARKVEPLHRVLAGKTAWITGLRRADAPGRAGAPVVARDLLRGVVKINPIATWSDDDVEQYLVRHDLPRHPLADKGYASIGCWPCTRPVLDGHDARSGRWAGLRKTECGLHT